jgi:hypothetical protein
VKIQAIVLSDQRRRNDEQRCHSGRPTWFFIDKSSLGDTTNHSGTADRARLLLFSTTQKNNKSQKHRSDNEKADTPGLAHGGNATAVCL